MKERLQGAFIFVMGLGLALLFHSEYLTGGEIFSDKLLALTPLLLLCGLAYMIEPRLLIASRKSGPALPGVYKAVNGILLVVGIGIGLYIRYGVFKEWH